MLLASILVIISLRGSNGFKIPGVDSIFDIDGYYELTKEVVSKAQFAADRGEAVRLFDDRCEVMLGELMEKVEEVSEKIDAMSEHMLFRLDKMEQLIRGIADDVQKKFLMHKVVDSMKIVFGKYDKFIAYAKMEKRPKKKFIKFLQDVISSGSEGVEEELNKIHRIVVPGKRTSSIEETVLDVLVNVLNAKTEERCNEPSPQHLLHTIYSLIVTTELTGFQTIVYSAKLLEKECQNNETDLEIKFITGSLHKRMEEYDVSFRLSMKHLSRLYRTCDLDDASHVRRDTFLEMWGLIQIILYHEFDFINQRNCRGECGDKYGRRDYGSGCYIIPKRGSHWQQPSAFPWHFDKCTTPRACMGWIQDCRTIWTANYCLLKWNSRRYGHIQDSYNGGKVYGQWSSCEGGISAHFDWDVDSEYRSKADCGLCMCTCLDDFPNSMSIHDISLRESRSNYESNRVVVGMKLREVERVMQIQVKEGEIGPNYSIDEGTVQWVPLPDVVQHKGQEGREYHLFKQNHAFNMNEVLLEGHRVVVGVRYAKSERKESEAVHIEIQVKSMAFNPKTGKLIEGTDRWEKSNVTHDSKIDVSGYLPQIDKDKSEMKSKSNQYVRLRASDLDADASQTVLPLFDGQTVETKPAAAMGGAGLHYRAGYSHAGYIGLSGYSLDYVKILDHFKDNESPDANDESGSE